jgi:hypothetical protein
MTTKQYKTAMGKVVDMGALMLQNENIRAVGNMSANARGDKLDSANRVIDRKNQQIKRQQKKHVAPENLIPATSNAALRRAEVAEMKIDPMDNFDDLPEDTDAEVVPETAPVQETKVPQGGLAAAIAKAKTVQQTKLPTLREAAKSSGVRKI